MPLLDGDLRSRLPPIYGQEADDDPVVFARFHLPGTSTAWYVIGGELVGEHYQFYGFVGQPENTFAEFSLTQLEALRGPQGQPVERDLAFIEGRLTEVVPAPEL